MASRSIFRIWDRVALRLSARMLKWIFARFQLPFILEDEFGILTKRLATDNIEYILRTRHSCDAAPLMTALREQRWPDGICVDVGANIGIVTAFLSQRAKWVYAFEPEARNLKRLRETLALNHCSNVVICDQALAAEPGAAKLYVLESYGHHSLGPVATSRIVDSKAVSVTSLDVFCEVRGLQFIDFLKVDVEGFEQEVFAGAKRLLTEKRIGLIAFEISDVPLKSLGKCASEIFTTLESHGYRVETLAGQVVHGADNVSHSDFFARPAARIHGLPLPSDS